MARPVLLSSAREDEYPTHRLHRPLTLEAVWRDHWIMHWVAQASKPPGDLFLR